MFLDQIDFLVKMNASLFEWVIEIRNLEYVKPIELFYYREHRENKNELYSLTLWLFLHTRSSRFHLSLCSIQADLVKAPIYPVDVEKSYHSPTSTPQL